MTEKVCCIAGDIDIVKEEIKSGVSDERLYELFDNARFHNHDDVAAFIIESMNIEQCTDVRFIDDIFVFCCETGEINMVKYCLDIKQADVNAINDMCESALSLACLGNHIDIVTLLIERSVDIHRWSRLTPLVAGLEYIDIIKILLNAGADINEYGEDGYPLNEAIKEGNLDVLRLLLEQPGIAINGPHGDYICTPLYDAIKIGRPDIVQNLVEKGAFIFEELFESNRTWNRRRLDVMNKIDQILTTERTRFYQND